MVPALKSKSYQVLHAIVVLHEVSRSPVTVQEVQLRVDLDSTQIWAFLAKLQRRAYIEKHPQGFVPKLESEHIVTC